MALDYGICHVKIQFAENAQVPSLFWVLVTLSVVVYVSALAMRATVRNISGKYDGPGSSVATKNGDEHIPGIRKCLFVLSCQKTGLVQERIANTAQCEEFKRLFQQH